MFGHSSGVNSAETTRRISWIGICVILAAVLFFSYGWYFQYCTGRLARIRSLAINDSGHGIFREDYTFPSNEELISDLERVSIYDLARGDSLETAKFDTALIVLSARGQSKAVVPIRNFLVRLVQHVLESKILNDELKGAFTLAAWSLVRLEGIRQVDFLDKQLSQVTRFDAGFSSDLSNMIETICWSFEEEAPVRWKYGATHCFDEYWPDRFLQSAIDTGHEIDASTKERLVDSLVGVLDQQFKEYASGLKLDWRSQAFFQRHWTAASCSILLGKLTGESFSRQLYPFGLVELLGTEHGDWIQWHTGQQVKREK